MKKRELAELYAMMFPDYPDIVTVAQLQQMLGVSRHLAYRLIEDGALQSIKIGNSGIYQTEEKPCSSICYEHAHACSSCGGDETKLCLLRP